MLVLNSRPLVGRHVQSARDRTNAHTENPSLSLEEVFAERFHTLSIPVLRGLMIGHVSDQATLPIGAQAHLDTSKLTLRAVGAYLAD